MKAAKAEDDAVKDEFKRMCKPYTDDGHGVICYSFANEMKMAVTLSGGGLSLDERKLMESIYAAYGEEVGNRDGKAWAAWCAVTEPVESRKVNEDKLAYELAKAQRIASGLEAGEVMVNADMVNGATFEKAPTISAKCSAMSKTELKAHRAGELVDVMVVK